MAIAVLGAAASLPIATASAATIAPNTTADEFGTGASCSLREAVQSANTNTAFGGCSSGQGGDSVLLRKGTYALTIPPDGTPDDNADGDLDVISAGTFELLGEAAFERVGSLGVVIDGGGLDRLLDIQAGAVSDVRAVTLRNGNAAGPGGAIRSDDDLLLLDSTLTGNSTQASGGAIAAIGGDLGATNVTVSGNRANGDSGGIDTSGAATTTELRHVTATANTADADNSGAGGGGGVGRTNGSVRLQDTIVAGNTDASPGAEAPDCLGALTSLGHNLIGNLTGCGLVPTGGDKTGVAAGLGSLADNGGPTMTHALLPSSPAIDAGVVIPNVYGSEDQRGLSRLTKPDVGAYERTLCAGVVVNKIGTYASDKITGTARADGILGLSGRDSIKGLAGNDAICGGVGRDVIQGGKGNDRLHGDAGRDRLVGGQGNDLCRGGPGKDKTKGC